MRNDSSLRETPRWAWANGAGKDKPTIRKVSDKNQKVEDKTEATSPLRVRMQRLGFSLCGKRHPSARLAMYTRYTCYRGGLGLKLFKRDFWGHRSYLLPRHRFNSPAYWQGILEQDTDS